MKRSGLSDFVVSKGALRFLPRNSKTAEAYAGSAVKLKVLVVLSISILLLSCHNNPVDSGGGFPVKAGPILFISDKSGSSQLYSMNEGGSNVQQLTSDSAFPILDAKWSPDGSKIAVVSLIGDEMTYPSFRDAIFIMNADGSNKYQLTKEWLDIYDSAWGMIEYGGAKNPVWSPDSKQIAYGRLMIPEALGNWDIFLINSDGTAERRVTETVHLVEGAYDWSGDGKSLIGVVGDYTDTQRLCVFDLQGVVLRSWGSTGEMWGVPVLSRTGNQIAFGIHANYVDDVFVMSLQDTDGSGRVSLTNGKYLYPRPVAYSTDDSKILLNVGYRNAEGYLHHEIVLMNSDGSAPKEITPFDADSADSEAASWRR